MENIPIFVYGSLLTGFHNSRIIPPKFNRVEGVLLEADLYDYCGSFPMAVNGDGRIVGELVTIPDKEYNSVLSRLDTLEGYHGSGKINFYNRVQKTVVVNNTKIKAWVYIGNNRQVSGKNRVKSGNWKQYKQGD